MNIYDSKRRVQENVNSNINKLFNESERKALSTLFKSNEEFECFDQKIGSLQKQNSSLEKKILMQIKLLTRDNDNKVEQIEYLQAKLKECESKVKTLEHKLNCEKFLLKQTKKSLNNQNSLASAGKTIVSNRDFKNSSFEIKDYSES